MGAKEFIEKYLPFALEIQESWGVPASLTLAQSGLELGWVEPESNNMFGVKESDGYKSILYSTKEDDGTGVLTPIIDSFNYYDTIYDSFEHYAKILHKDHFYQKGWKGLDSISAITAIQSGEMKYATDTKYVDKITDIIKQHDLQQYDVLGYTPSNVEESEEVDEEGDKLPWWKKALSSFYKVATTSNKDLLDKGVEKIKEKAYEEAKPLITNGIVAGIIAILLVVIVVVIVVMVSKSDVGSTAVKAVTKIS